MEHDNNREHDYPNPSTSQQPPAQPQAVPWNSAAASTSQPPVTRPLSSPTSVTPPRVITVPRSTDSYPDDGPYSDVRRDRLGNPLPPLPIDPHIGPGPDLRAPPRTRTVDTHNSGRARSGLDWIVPVEEKPHPKRTVAERLDPTLTRAHLERDKYAMKAKMTGYALNAAIGMQVLLGSLTTGLSAATTSGRQAAIATTVLGGLSTLVASYLARARGSNEPELSITRVKDLEQFIRECQAFQMDFGHITSGEHDEQLFRFRSKFEELLGNASGERKLSPPV